VTRRDAIRLAAAAALAPLAAPARSSALTRDDVKKMEQAAVAAAVGAEQTAMVAFEAIANGGMLDNLATGAMRVLLDHASQHAALLAQTFESQLGKDPPLPPTRTAIPGLAGLRGQQDALKLATELEGRAIAAHLRAVQQTRDAQLLTAIAGIVGSDGQGLVLLRQLVHTQPVPSAFERGAP
jgi:Ferritin-like domain